MFAIEIYYILYKNLNILLSCFYSFITFKLRCFILNLYLNHLNVIIINNIR